MAKDRVLIALLASALVTSEAARNEASIGNEWETLENAFIHWTKSDSPVFTLTMKYQETGAEEDIFLDEVDEASTVAFLASSLFWPTLSSLVGEQSVIEEGVSAAGASLCSILSKDDPLHFDGVDFRCKSGQVSAVRRRLSRGRLGRKALAIHQARRAVRQGQERALLESMRNLAAGDPSRFTKEALIELEGPPARLPPYATFNTTMQYLANPSIDSETN